MMQVVGAGQNVGLDWPTAGEARPYAGQGKGSCVVGALKTVSTLTAFLAKMEGYEEPERGRRSGGKDKEGRTTKKRENCVHALVNPILKNMHFD